MRNARKNRIILAVNILLFAVVILFQISDIASLKIKTASPLLILPLLSAFAIFNTPSKSVLMGFIAGASLDAVSAKFGFNTICLMLLGLGVCLAANNLFNKNISAAMVLSLICASIYFVCLWFAFHLFGATVQDSLGYLLRYGFPSAVYSAVFMLPFFYIYRYLESLKTQ